MIQIYTDGATEGHNGKLGTVKFCGIGFHIPETGMEYSKRIEAGSNNEAEFWALIAAMKYAQISGYKCVQFLLDSQIVVNRAKGRKPSGQKNQNIRMDKLQNHVIDLIPAFHQVEFVWIAREHNRVADRLSKQSLYLHS